jgi:hypothetical protein
MSPSEGDPQKWDSFPRTPRNTHVHAILNPKQSKEVYFGARFMLKFLEWSAFCAYMKNRGMFFREYGIKSLMEGVNGG